MTLSAKNISISINRPPRDVYQYMANAMNLPKWAAGLANANLTKSGDEWVTDSPMGKVRVKFAPENPYGVLDHDVILPSGEVNHNPLRVVQNAGGSEVIFTLFRQPRMTDEDLQKDARQIEMDLRKLKSILEQ